MKRKLSLFLALLMILSCLTPALAADEFDTYGPYDYWTEEEWAATEQWTEDQWADYWADYEIWWAEYQDEYWDNYWREEKVALGMPHPDGINVCLNGTFLNFGDTAPAAVNNRTMVPFRVLLETLGAKVDYDDGHITALFADGTLMEMHLDSNIMEITENGETRPLQMDVAPWVDTAANRVLVPVRFIGEALGLDVDWDSYFEVAHLTNWDAIAAEIDSHFTILNKILAASLNQDMDGTFLTKSDFSIAGTLYGEKENDTATLSVSGESLSNGLQMSGEYTVNVDLGNMKDTIFSTLPQEVFDLIDALNKGRFQMIMDAEEGNLFFKGSALSELTDGMLPSNKWISMGDGMMPTLSYEDLLGSTEAFTVGALMVESMRDVGYYGYYLCPVQDLMEQVTILRLLMDDSCFTTKTSGSTTTYTADMTLLKLFTRAVDMGLFSAGDLLDSNLPTGAYKLVVSLKDDKVTDLSLSGNVKVSGVFPVEMTFDLKSDGTSSACTVEFKGAYVGKIEMRATDVVTPSTKTVPTAPPSGEEILDYMTLLEAYYEKLYNN